MATANTERIKADRGQPKLAAQFTAEMWRGNSTTFLVGLFLHGVAESVANISSLTFRVKTARMGGDVVMNKTLPGGALTECTAAAWQEGSGQHAAFIFGNEECALAFSGKKAVFYVTLSGLLVGGETVIFGVGELHAWNANEDAANAPPPPGETPLTVEMADGRYLLIESLANDRVVLPNGKFIYVSNPD